MENCKILNNHDRLASNQKMEKSKSAHAAIRILPFAEVGENVQELLKCSIEAGKASYSPYSKFPVGAALLCDNNEIYQGCNVENVSLGLTICAEQTAIVKAISDGKTNFKAIAVWADSKVITTPCGKCRQFILEFGNEIDVYCVRSDMKEVLVTSSSKLLPYGFTEF